MTSFAAKNTCGKPTYAECVTYETAIPPSSDISDEPCPSLEQTTEDLYDRTESLLDATNLEELGNDCLVYAEKSVKEVLLVHEEEICTIKTEIDDLKSQYLCDISLYDCELDYGTLVDSCGTQPQTLKDLLQILIDQHQAS